MKAFRINGTDVQGGMPDPDEAAFPLDKSARDRTAGGKRVGCKNTGQCLGTRYCKQFRFSFYTSTTSIFFAIVIVLLILDIVRHPPTPAEFEQMKEQRMFYVKHLLMPLLAMVFLFVHLIFFTRFNIYLIKIVSMIGKCSAYYITPNLLTMPLGSIYVFFRIRSLAMDKGFWTGFEGRGKGN